MSEAPNLLPDAHLPSDETIRSLLSQGWDTPLDLATRAYDLGYQAAMLEIQAQQSESCARGGNKRSLAQQQHTARLNGYSSLTGPLPRIAPGIPWTAEEDALVLAGGFPATHTREACYARRSRLRRKAL